MPENRLLVIGAGPKALAIAAKAASLKSLGFRNVPEVMIIERDGVGAHWKGSKGFTDGNSLLGTPPEKDLGFPYRSSEWGSFNPRVDDHMLAYGWQRFKVLSDSESPFWDWIDRGRPHPRHKHWARYLEWAAEEIPASLVRGEVTKIDITNELWKVVYATEGREAEALGTGLVITGPGAPAWIPGDLLESHRYFNSFNFWQNLEVFDRTHIVSVCVIGAGETAAAVVAALLEKLSHGSEIFVVSPYAFIYSRGENYLENRVFSDPTAAAWETLEEADRREFIRRADRGVFSQVVHDKINNSPIPPISIPGRAGDPRLTRRATVQVEVEYQRIKTVREFDYVVDAARFDRAWFWKLFTPDARLRIKTVLKGILEDVSGKEKLELIDENPNLLAGLLEPNIDANLRLRNLKPDLFLPMLSSLTRGPGFPNLSCLGLLSDRVLKPYAIEPEGLSR